MDQLATFEYAMEELRRTVATLDDSHMETVTNCEPWTVRRLASHALNNQLLWAGLVTGQQLVSVDDTMGAVPLRGRSRGLRRRRRWRGDGDVGHRRSVGSDLHASPFGELPGSVVVTFRDHRRGRPRLGPLVERRSPDRVRAAGDPINLDDRRRSLHRRCRGRWASSRPPPNPRRMRPTPND